MFNGNVNSRNETGLCLQVRKRMGEKKEEKKKKSGTCKRKKICRWKKRRKKKEKKCRAHHGTSSKTFGIDDKI